MKDFLHSGRFSALLFLLLNTWVSSQSQPTALASAGRNSAFTYIYKISNEALIKFYNQKYRPFPISVNQLPVDSFNSDSSFRNFLPHGNYVFAYVAGNKIFYRVEIINDFEVKVLRDPHFLSVAVFKRDGTVISDALVQIGNKKIPFDSSQKCYRGGKSTGNGLLIVTVNGHLNVSGLSSRFNGKWYLRPLRSIYYLSPLDNVVLGIRNKGNPFAYFNYKTKQYGYTDYSGYVITNQPRYRMGDTVKIKAYLIGSNMKPIHKKLVLTVSSDYPSKIIFSDTVAPVTKGDFLYEFVLGDTIMIDKNYEILFTSLDEKKIGASGNFRLEDYQLDETFYQVDFSTHNFINIEPVTFSIGSHDANGLPLPDSKVEILLLPNSYDASYLQSQYVKDTIWHYRGMLDPDGKTELSIPDSVLPRARMNLKAQFYFTNTNNEIRDTIISCYIDKPEKIIDLYLEGENVNAKLIEKGREIPASANLKVIDVNHRVLSEGEIILPFSKKVNLLAAEYIIEFEKRAYTLKLSAEESDVTPNAHRTYDSVFLMFKNPRRVPVSYSIFNGNEEVLKGLSDNDFEWKKYDHTKSSWYLTIQYFWGGISKGDFAPAILYDKELNVEIDQPSDVYPGQEADVKIRVTDYHGDPVSHVNIAASSVTSQFENFQLPTVPNFNKARGRLKYFNSYQMNEVEKEFQNYLNFEWVKRFRLDTSLFYHFIYPQKAIIVYQDSVGTIDAQFSVYQYSNGSDFPLFMIYANDRLVFFSGTGAIRPYSLVIEPGKYQLRIRTNREEFVTDSIAFKKGFKTEIVINPHFADTAKNVSVRHLRTKLSKGEVDLLRKSLFFLRVDKLKPQEIFIRSGKNIFSTTSSYSGNKGFVSVGPFNTGDPIEVIAPGQFSHTIPFEPQMNYLVSPSLIWATQQVNSPFSTGTSLNQFYSQLPLGGLSPTDLALVRESKPQYRIKPFSPRQPSNNSRGNGSLSLTNATDSVFYVLILSRKDQPDHLWILDGQLKTYYDLLPGYYSIKLYTEHGSSLQVDSILIKPASMRWQTITEEFFFPPDTSTSEWRNIFFPEVYHSLFRQYSFGDCMLQGRVSDEKTGEGIPFANVLLMVNGEAIAHAETDEDGNYKIRNIAAGIYNLNVRYLGYENNAISQVQLQKGKITFQDIKLYEAILSLQDVVVTAIGITESSKAMSYSTMSTMTLPYAPNQGMQALSGKVSGVFQMDEEVALNIGGARAAFTKYYIDGIAVGGLPGSYGDINSDILLPQNQSSIREKFSDYAYWQPNLLTDDSGFVSFRVKFPDNITKWNSYALAMHNRNMSGSVSTFSRSWKKLSASLETPRFLVEGDQSEVIGKVMNYTGKKIQASMVFELRGEQISKRDTGVSDFQFEKFQVSAKNGDSIQCVYSVNAGNYFDGEKERIPIVPQGIKRAVGNFYVLNKDTVIRFIASNSGEPIFISAHSDPIDIFRDDIDFLEKYPYQCNEQLSSKLIAAVCSQLLNGSNHSTRQSTYSGKLVNKLFRNQRPDGSWGWWKDSYANNWMTCYVLHALGKAKMDRSSIQVYKGINFLRSGLGAMNSYDLIDALQVLKEFKEPLDYDFYLSKIELDTSNAYAQMKYALLLRELSKPVNIEKIFSQKHETIFGNIYWGNNEYSWYDNNLQLSILAYKILKLDSNYKKELARIRSYFLEQRNSSVNSSSTVETALVLETILPDLLAEQKGAIAPLNLKINGETVDLSRNSIRSKKYEVKEMDIEKSGSSPAYLACYQNFFEPSPVRKEDDFIIKTTLVSVGRSTDTLIGGKYASMHIDLTVNRKSDYVMISIPIPAGCSYGDNALNRFFYESHREYFKDKVIIFCEVLDPGHYEFDLKLEPRFKGLYTLNPAQVELMYFPTFNGNNTTRKIVIQ